MCIHINIPNNLISKKKITTELNKNIGIAPGAGSELRQWDFDKYLEVGKYLRQKGFNIYFFLGPEEKRYLDVCINNNFIHAKQIHYKLNNFMNALLSVSSNPIPVKTILAYLGKIKEEFRLPLCSLGADAKRTLIQIYKDYLND